VKLVLAVATAALLVLAGGVGGYLLADDGGDGGADSSALPAGWDLCVNDARGFAIGHPGRWFTDAVAEEESCEFFDSEPFQVPRQSDFSGTALEMFAFDRDPKRLTEEELELLSTFATPREIQGWREFGGYIGWRAGIEPDGDWVFYVAGD
jgi:hypothetical protein